MFKDRKTYKLPSEYSNLDEFGSPSTVYLCDSRPPVPTDKTFTLVVTSPKKKNWSEFVKSKGVVPLVLPVFSEAEIWKLREVAFKDEPGCSKAEVAERFRKWGGSARNVFTKGAVKSWQHSLERAPSGLLMRVLETALSGDAALDGVADKSHAHRLLNLVPGGAIEGSTLPMTSVDYYEFHHAEPMSPYVAGLFMTELLHKDRVEVYRFLHGSATDVAIAGFRGTLYERTVAIPRLRDGNEAKPLLTLKRLSPPLGVQLHPLLQGGSLELRRGLPVVRFGGVDDLGAKWRDVVGDAVFVPLSKQWPVVDCVLRIGGTALLANATVGDTHSVKVDNTTFRSLLDATGLMADEGAEIPLLWVLPRDAYSRFSEPGALKSAGGATLVSGASAQHVVGRRLAQYALLVEVPEAAAMEAAAACPVVPLLDST